MLIAFSGIDGSGKSTTIFLLKTYYEKKGKNVEIIDPMKGGLMNSLLKNLTGDIDPTLFSATYASDMIAFMSNLNLNEPNTLYLSHRYDLCCKVYAELGGANLKYLSALLSALPQPDLYIHMIISPNVASNRLIERENLTHKESLSNLCKATDIYNKNLSSINKEKIIYIDNNEQDALNDKVSALIKVIDSYI